MQFKVTKQGTAPTYEAVYNITQSYLLDSDGDLDWEFLMIEVKLTDKCTVISSS